VIADNSWAAMQARKKLKCEWELGPNAKHNSKEYLQELVKRVEGEGEVIRSRGDVKKAFDENSDQHSATYTVPYLAHATMEPPAATAIYHGDGNYELWACTQAPQGTQDTVAQELGTTPEKVKVHVTLLGGAFGRKSKPDFSVEACFLAKQLKQPVKVTWTREDDIHFDYFHAISAQHHKAALNNKGEVKGWIQRVAYPTIGATFNPAADRPQDFELGLGFADIPFEFDNLSCERLPASTHLRIGWLRSVDNIHQAFAIQSFLDELARKSKKDTKQFMLEAIGSDRLVDPNKEGFKYGNYGEPLEKYPIDTARIKAVLNHVAEKSGYGSKLPKGEGWGIAVHRSFLTYVAVVSKVKLENNRVSIKEIHCTVDCGFAVNPDRVHSQMEGAMMFGASIALMSEISTKDGRVEQSNFNDYSILRMNQCPDISVHILKTDNLPTGVGEPGVPPVAPSITNAIVDAGGKRIRNLPISKHYQV
jgi:isoquinoline 1-oxidoreductase beta subunit